MLSSSRVLGNFRGLGSCGDIEGPRVTIRRWEAYIIFKSRSSCLLTFDLVSNTGVVHLLPQLLASLQSLSSLPFPAD
jgi:hypothetical protein